ncbi:Dak1-domain-containing protein [Sanghuangporus baumii]|uniref:Dak1-domain-containing protein n=1 Tax=Sanghuangporus baumii TaxID=108892 RepID=A0A9Q5HTX8_SANBA|nr:Dak1-domain-containing protein [Sanghuangporus baumii]
MSTKHVFESSDGLVLKALRGAVALNPDLRLHAPTKSVYAKTRGNARVALISGGGAGHEPAHAGYTGRGMLAASVSGDIFASPSASQILTCIQLALATQKTNEVLLIVNNYTGDRLNFGLAAERALSLSLHTDGSSEKGGNPQVEVETVVVADDVSLLNQPSLVGPRGLAGNILVCKILGAAAESSLDLSSLKKLGDAVVANLASIGVGLAHCHVPGRSMPSEKENIIEDGMCELGLGLHNEPGVRRLKVGSAEELVGEMLEQILSSSERRAKVLGNANSGEKFVQNGDEVILYVNNLGGMSTLEMSAIVDEAVSQLESKNIYPSRVLLSSYMTSLNAPGFSLSLLNLTSISRMVCTEATEAVSTSELLSFIDAPTDATAWTGIRSHWPIQGTNRDRSSEERDSLRLLETFSTKLSKEPSDLSEKSRPSKAQWPSLEIDPERVKSGIRGACASVLAVENDLTRFDTIVGDGDCGATFSGGARAILEALDEDELDVDRLSPAELMAALSELLLNSMGGTSGALFGLYFTALSNALSSSTSTSNSIREAPFAALRSLSTHTPARPGDRTIIDSLSPFCSALSNGESLETSAKKAREGAESTRGMRAKLGRATYVGNHHHPDARQGDEEDPSLPPDPGAWGVAALLDGLVHDLTQTVR